MDEQHQDDQLHGSTEGERETDPDWLKTIRAKARAYDSEVPGLKRKIAVAEAGIDTSSPIYGLFETAFTAAGKEWTADAVREEASKYAQFGLVKTAPATDGTTGDAQPAAPAQTVQTPEQVAEAQAHQRISDASNGAGAPDGGAIDYAALAGAGGLKEFLQQYEAAGGQVQSSA